MSDGGGFVSPEIVRTDRRIAYKNRWMNVWGDQVVFPDGSGRNLRLRRQNGLRACCAF